MKMKTKLTALAVAISAQLMPVGNLAIWPKKQSAEQEQDSRIDHGNGQFCQAQ